MTTRYRREKQKEDLEREDILEHFKKRFSCLHCDSCSIEAAHAMDVRQNIYRTFDVNGIPLDTENQNPTATPGAPAVDV